MNFIKDNSTTPLNGAGLLHISCSGLAGSCSTSTAVKKAAEQLDKSKNNGTCNKT